MFKLKCLLITTCFLFIGCEPNGHEFIKHYSYKSAIAISLNNLADTLEQLNKKNYPIPDNIKRLGGISDLYGYIVDRKNNDIILVGACITPFDSNIAEKVSQIVLCTRDFHKVPFWTFELPAELASVLSIYWQKY